MAKAQGQFTIIDYNDALTLTGYIGTNLAKTQMYHPDNGSYTPDWTTTNMVLTPSLFVAGIGADMITGSAVQRVLWYKGSETTPITAGGDYGLSGTKNEILTIKNNVMAGLPGVDYRCVVSYKDSTTQLVLSYVMSISFSRVENGGGIVDLIVTTPNGNMFKNDLVTSLTASAELWRGSLKDETNVSYQWFKMDSAVTSDEGGGVGWKKLTNVNNMYGGVTTATLTVYAAAVDSYATFKCVAKDTDTSSVTYNKTFIDVASFVDLSDPIFIQIESTGGNIFKNNVGSTNLTAKVFQAGTEIDTAGNGDYTWTKYNKDGTLDTTWNTTGHKKGKTLAVGSDDVEVKATFMVEVVI